MSVLGIGVGNCCISSAIQIVMDMDVSIGIVIVLGIGIGSNAFRFLELRLQSTVIETPGSHLVDFWIQSKKCSNLPEFLTS